MFAGFLIRRSGSILRFMVLMIEAKFETVPMRYFAKPFVPSVSAPVPTLRLAHNKLVINGLKILIIFLRIERNFRRSKFRSRAKSKFWNPA